MYLLESKSALCLLTYLRKDPILILRLFAISAIESDVVCSSSIAGAYFSAATFVPEHFCSLSRVTSGWLPVYTLANLYAIRGIHRQPLRWSSQTRVAPQWPCYKSLSSSFVLRIVGLRLFPCVRAPSLSVALSLDNAYEADQVVTNYLHQKFELFARCYTQLLHPCYSDSSSISAFDKRQVS